MNEVEALAALAATMPKDGNGGWWALGASIVVAISPKAYSAFRKVKVDREGDSVEEEERKRVAREDERTERQVVRADEANNVALSQLEKANAALERANEKSQARQDLLDKRIDTMAAERNVSIVKEVTLLGELNALKIRFEEGRVAREEAKVLVTALGVKLDLLKADNEILTASNATLKARVAHLESQLLTLAPKHPEFDAPLGWTDSQA